METSMPRNSIIKWKWFTQDHATARTQGGDTHQQGGFFPLALSLEIHEELLDFVVTWTPPYKKLSSSQQRAAWFMISRSKVNGQHSIRKDTTVTMEGKNRSARWTELHAACHDILVVTYSLAVSYLAIWSGRRKQKSFPSKGCPCGAQPYGNCYGNLRDALKQGMPTPIRRTSFQHLRVTGIDKQVSPYALLRWPLKCMKQVGYVCTAAKQGSAKSRYILLVPSEA